MNYEINPPISFFKLIGPFGLPKRVLLVINTTSDFIYDGIYRKHI